MADVILDTNLLADLMAQYYDQAYSDRGFFINYKTLNSELIREINKIIAWHTESDWGDISFNSPGLIIASTFAFVEIARKFQVIVDGRFTLEQFAAFIDQPPEWFFISSVDSTLVPYLAELPAEVRLSNGDVKPIELADAIHLATAMSRDEYLIATTDARMRKVGFLSARFV